MTITEAIDARHSVRSYKDVPIPAEIRKQLDDFTETCNREGNLHIFIRYDDADGFDSRLAHYGSFRNVKNYIVLAGKKDDDFDIRCGYYGEKLVLFAQQLGLNTCWAALTFNKKKVKELIPAREALCMVIALGYGETAGTPHKSKKASDVISLADSQPEWFQKGVEAALKAPTAVNQQKFQFICFNEKVVVRAKGLGTYTKVDLGIVAWHFEAASGHKVGFV
ncbi:MAG: nitroreductase [Oscillospiraceae bacterium]|nr:nitroreductase [Oscillospiraceae bacterium]